MMERFNFYDIYGYFLPGVFWLALLWLPFILITGFPSERTAELTVVGLLFGYIAGLLLQHLARGFLSSSIRDTTGKPRQPSDFLLDEGDQTLSSALKSGVAHHVSRRFGIDVVDAVDAAPGNRKRERDDAFRLCRTALAQGKVGSYAEQYQGLYSLMRGLAASCILAIGFYLGWVLALFLPASGSSRGSFSGGILVAGLAALGILLQRSGNRSRRKGRSESTAFWLFGIMLVALGFIAGHWYEIAGPQAFVLGIVTLLLLVASRRFSDSSRYFMKTWAESVYRDFLALATAETGKEDASE